MKTKVDPIGENEVELSVDVPAETVKKAYDRAVAKVRGEMQLPGFRKGRVPVDLVIQNVGADFIRTEALEDGDGAVDAFRVRRRASRSDDADGVAVVQAVRFGGHESRP